MMAGLHDPRVAYWEPAKFVAKLRDFKTDDNMQLFKCDFGAGAHLRRTAAQADISPFLKQAALQPYCARCERVHQAALHMSGQRSRTSMLAWYTRHCAALLQSEQSAM